MMLFLTIHPHQHFCFHPLFYTEFSVKVFPLSSRVFFLYSRLFSWLCQKDSKNWTVYFQWFIMFAFYFLLSNLALIFQVLFQQLLLFQQAILFFLSIFFFTFPYPSIKKPDKTISILGFPNEFKIGLFHVDFAFLNGFLHFLADFYFSLRLSLIFSTALCMHLSDR